MEVRPSTLTADNLKDAPEWDVPPWSCNHYLYQEYPPLPVDPAKGQKAANLAKKLA